MAEDSRCSGLLLEDLRRRAGAPRLSVSSIEAGDKVDDAPMIEGHIYQRNAHVAGTFCWCGGHLKRHRFVSGWDRVTGKRGMPKKEKLPK